MAKRLILGAGPAGVSAALYAVRGGADVTVVSRGVGTSALSRAEKIENYYGLTEAVSGRELEQRGIEGAKKIGVKFVEDEVLELGFADDFKSFRAVAANGTYVADAVIIAAGAARKAPNIDGVKRLTGHGVSYCAVCDGFFYRGKTVAVLGAGDYAVHETQVLLPLVGKVLLLTDGAAVPDDLPDGILPYTEKVAAITGQERVTGAVLDNKKEVYFDGLFIAFGTAGSAELARKLGVMLDENGNVQVGADMTTNVPGIFAAGDCAGGILQVAKAVWQGAAAGLSAVKFLRGK